MNFGWYFFMYFLPGFMKKQFGAAGDSPGDRMLLAFLMGGPLLVGVFGCLLGGVLTDRYVRKTGDRKRARRVYGMSGFALCAACYTIALFHTTDVYVFAGAIAMAGFFNDLTMGSCWATVQDVGRRYSAIVGGCMNMVGNIGAALTTLITGRIVKHSGDTAEAAAKAQGLADDLAAAVRDAAIQNDAFPICFAMYATAYACGVFFWYKIDASKPIVE